MYIRGKTYEGGIKKPPNFSIGDKVVRNSNCTPDPFSPYSLGEKVGEIETVKYDGLFMDITIKGEDGVYFAENFIGVKDMKTENIEVGDIVRRKKEFVDMQWKDSYTPMRVVEKDGTSIKLEGDSENWRFGGFFDIIEKGVDMTKKNEIEEVTDWVVSYDGDQEEYYETTESQLKEKMSNYISGSSETIYDVTVYKKYAEVETKVSVELVKS